MERRQWTFDKLGISEHTRRHTFILQGCPACPEPPETLLHVLQNRRKARKVWEDLVRLNFGELFSYEELEECLEVKLSRNR